MTIEVQSIPNGERSAADSCHVGAAPPADIGRIDDRNSWLMLLAQRRCVGGVMGGATTLSICHCKTNFFIRFFIRFGARSTDNRDTDRE